MVARKSKVENQQNLLFFLHLKINALKIIQDPVMLQEQFVGEKAQLS